MDVTLLGMFTEVKPRHPLKAHSPMDVTLLGMFTEVKPTRQLKALFPMDVTLSGMTVLTQPAIKVFVAVSMMALQSPRES